jgi:metallo-beta-lactamase family protein
MVNIKFFGAAQTVTGSCYLIESEIGNILIDCGMFQGKEIEYKNALPLQFDVKKINAVLLTHAHMDHSGMLPKLTKAGYKGKIYMTPPTSALATELLLDSAKIQEMKQNENKYSESMPLSLNSPIIYDTLDAINTIKLFNSCKFDEEISLGKDISFKFMRSGHILGAASISISILGKNILFSGDIGRVNQSIVIPFTKNMDDEKEYNCIIMESLYGGKIHPSKNEELAVFYDKINYTIKNYGNVIIPCFAVHRTQEIIEILHYGYINKLINKDVQIFLDSPLAQKATKIYTSFSSYLMKYNKIYKSSINYNDGVDIREENEKGGAVSNYENRFQFDVFKTINHSKQSLRLKNKKQSIIIAGSGMADGGRIVSHIANNIADHNSSILFVGFQAENTLGRALVEGSTKVFIKDKSYSVKANIHKFSSFSGHADNDELQQWLSMFNKSNNCKVVLTHSEVQNSTIFAKELKEKNIDVYIPTEGDSIII